MLYGADSDPGFVFEVRRGNDEKHGPFISAMVRSGDHVPSESSPIEGASISNRPSHDDASKIRDKFNERWKRQGKPRDDESIRAIVNEVRDQIPGGL